jgi:hypothetical protein
MVVGVLPSRSSAAAPDPSVEAALDHLKAMARLASECKLTVHVVVPRAPGLVDAARRVAAEAGVTCAVSLRARTIRAQFGPASEIERP